MILCMKTSMIYTHASATIRHYAWGREFAWDPGRRAMPDRNRQILLVETPKGKLGPEHFRLAEAPLPTPQEGEVLARVRYISLDAANRAWMQGATYRSAVGAAGGWAGAGPAGGAWSHKPRPPPRAAALGRTRLAGLPVAAARDP